MGTDFWPPLVYIVHILVQIGKLCNQFMIIPYFACLLYLLHDITEAGTDRINIVVLFMCHYCLL